MNAIYLTDWRGNPLTLEEIRDSRTADQKSTVGISLRFIRQFDAEDERTRSLRSAALLIDQNGNWFEKG